MVNNSINIIKTNNHLST